MKQCLNLPGKAKDSLQKGFNRNGEKNNYGRRRNCFNKDEGFYKVFYPGILITLFISNR